LLAHAGNHGIKPDSAGFGTSVISPLCPLQIIANAACAYDEISAILKIQA
jgi:hypothetical protein